MKTTNVNATDRKLAYASPYDVEPAHEVHNPVVRAGMSASSPAGTLSSALQPLNRPDAEVAFVVFSKSFSGTLFSAVQL